MLPKQDCKYTDIFVIHKFYLTSLLTFLRNLRIYCYICKLKSPKVFGAVPKGTKLQQTAQWGCFGFDSIRHWMVSTPGVGSLPVNLSFRTYSWQQLLCTRCVVC